jgi:hypothetical protein
MRLVLVLVLAGLVFAYVVPTESLDVYFWATPGAVVVRGFDGAELWRGDAVYPLVATDAAGRCFAVVNRPYLYNLQIQPITLQISVPTTAEFSPDLLETLRRYGISLPPRVGIVLNFTLPLPPLILANVYKASVASLHTPYGYPLWAVNLGPKVNATAVATDCRSVLVGTVAGELYLLRDGKVVEVRGVGSPVTAAAYGRAGGVFYVGTADGRIWRYSAGSLAQVGACSGSVYALAAAPDGSPAAVCFQMGERPVVEHYPSGVRLEPAVLVTYGIDTPRVPAALSQDGRVFVVATFGEVVALSGGRVLWRVKVPATPTAIAASGNGSIVAVGTLGGDVLILWNGKEVARFLGDKIVTSVAVSVDGRTVVVERWDSASGLRLAFGRVVVAAPQGCLPVEVGVRVGASLYRYQLAGSGVVLLPVGKVSLEPAYRYMGDVRCRPLQNVTLDVRGDLEEPVEVRYVLEYRVRLSPPDVTRGPQWAAGPVTFYAEPTVEVPAVGLVSRGRLVLVGWRVDGRVVNLPVPTITVNVSGPVEVSALYRAELPPTVPIDDGHRLRLDNVVVFDAFGNPAASGLAPVASVYPATLFGSYVKQVKVSTAWPAAVNGSQVLWADVGSKVVFNASDYVFPNGTRLAFRLWKELNERSRVVVLTADRPISLTPIYAVEYRVWVKPPAYVAEPPNATWAERGSVIRVAAPPVIESAGNTRLVVDKWVINGVVNASLTGPTAAIRVTKPLNITFTTKRQYLVAFTSRYGTAPPSMWVDEGATAAAVPTPTDVWSPPPLHWVFAGWRDVATGVVYSYPSMPVVTGPATYEAVWSLDPLPLVAIGGAAAGAVFLIWFLRRRRLQRLMAEVAE